MSKSYPDSGRSTTALDGVDIDVERGAFAAVLGPSGSGKTTLLRCIAGFETPDAGSIELAGHDLFAAGHTVPPYERRVGIVPQEGALFPHLNAARNIAFGISDLPKTARQTRVEELLTLVGMVDFATRRPHQLSGGQQQRIALARALAPAPQLILLDEPFSALDAHLRVDLREEVRELLRGLDTTALLVTHDQDEAMAVADHLIVMRAGHVVSAGAPRSVYDVPADAELGRFLGDSTVLQGRIEVIDGRASVRCPLGLLRPTDPTLDTGPCEVLVRAENLRITTTSGALDHPASVSGYVVSQAFSGHDSLVRVQLTDGPIISVRVAGSMQYDARQEVAVATVSAVPTYPLVGAIAAPADRPIR